MKKEIEGFDLYYNQKIAKEKGGKIKMEKKPHQKPRYYLIYPHCETCENKHCERMMKKYTENLNDLAKNCPDYKDENGHDI